jgi:hypothetical protein
MVTAGNLLRLLASLSLANGYVLSAKNSNAWSANEFKTVVFFGDSYTDEGRGPYFVMTGGKVPPGWKEPEVSHNIARL